jgi:flagellar hook assembly protein FlgD
MSRAAVLRQNYPNPFNPSTTIEYRLHEGAKIILKVHDLRAREVRTLVDRDQSVGAKNVVWDGRDNAGRSVGSRVYVYRLRTGDAGTAESRKMLLVR